MVALITRRQINQSHTMVLFRNHSADVDLCAARSSAYNCTNAHGSTRTRPIFAGYSLLQPHAYERSYAINGQENIDSHAFLTVSYRPVPRIQQRKSATKACVPRWGLCRLWHSLGNLNTLTQELRTRHLYLRSDINPAMSSCSAMVSV